MPPRTTRRLASLAVAVLLAACNGSGGPFEPMSGGITLPVTLATTFNGMPVTDPSRLRITGVAGGAQVQWDVVSPACLIAEASARHVGSVIEVRIHRSGNPLASCVAAMVAYHYEANVIVPAPGGYEVRVVDDLLGQPLRPIGRAAVAVH